MFPSAGYTSGKTQPVNEREPESAQNGHMYSEADVRARGEAAPGESRAHELLLTGTRHEVLARIVPEDPLELGARLGARIAERALLLDVERALLCAQALCALHAVSWRGEPALAGWLDLRVEEALTAVLSEESQEGGNAEPLALFAAPLGLDPRNLARACARFNRLPFEQREAFFALVLDGVAADRLARARGLSLSELARRARAGLELFRSAARGRESASPGAPEKAP